MIRIVGMLVTADLQAVIHTKVIFILTDYPRFKFRLVDFDDLFVTTTKSEAKDNMRAKAILLF
jgi:hypothetical protein